MKRIKCFLALISVLTILSGCSNNSINKTESTIAEINDSSLEEMQITITSEKTTETEKLTEPSTAEYTPEPWQTAYADYINSMWEGKEPDCHFNYSLIYLDNDDIPELFVSTPAEASGEIVVTFYNGNLQTCQLSRIGSEYIERSGLIYSDNGHIWYFPVTITKLENGEFSVIGSGLDEYSLDENQNPLHKYTWESEEVSEEDFENNINKPFDKEKGIRPKLCLPLMKCCYYLKQGHVHQMENAMNYLQEVVFS